MTQPLVSICMITYNHAPSIVQAIEGVLQQKTTFPFELVIGEDCSTDNTREIVSKYHKKHPNIIRVITSDENIGATGNGLRTVKACQGKYIAFCEGDDHWHHPYKLQKQVDYLESYPDCGLVYSSYDMHHVESKTVIKDFVRSRKQRVPENQSISDIVEGNIAKGLCVPLTCTVMVRRTLCEQIIESDPYLHQSGHFLMGDTQLWAEMATKSRLYYIPESLATYNLSEESTSTSKNVKKRLRFSISVAELMLYLCNKYDLPQRLKDRYELFFAESSLRLAFHLRSGELADEARRRKKVFKCKEWFLYYGAKNLFVYYLFRLASLFRNLIRKPHVQWWQ
jgi:glycosyltransferase involved in cell wall biosynthesis